MPPGRCGSAFGPSRGGRGRTRPCPTATPAHPPSAASAEVGRATAASTASTCVSCRRPMGITASAVAVGEVSVRPQSDPNGRPGAPAVSVVVDGQPVHLDPRGAALVQAVLALHARTRATRSYQGWLHVKDHLVFVQVVQHLANVTYAASGD